MDLDLISQLSTKIGFRLDPPGYPGSYQTNHSHFIYKIVHRISGKVYIGQTCDVYRRFREHIHTNTTSYVHRAILKHGASTFSFGVIHSCLADEINNAEILAIANHDSLAPKGYNLLHGGFAQGHHAESRAKMSLSHTGKYVTPETRQRMSVARKGPLNPAYGKGGTCVKPVAQYDISSGVFIAEFPTCHAAAMSIGEDSVIPDLRKRIASATSSPFHMAHGFRWCRKNADGTFPVQIECRWPRPPKPPKLTPKVRTRSVLITHVKSGITQEFISIKDACVAIGAATPNMCAVLKGISKHTKGYTAEYID